MDELSESDVYLYKDKRLAMVAYPSFQRIRRQGKLCDVTLNVNGQKFSAHKVVLAATVPFFYGMFMHDMAEANKNEVTMQGIEPSALESLINYAYSGEIQITVDNVQDLFTGSSFLQLQEVKEACCEFMRKRLTPSNVIEVKRFAEQFLCSALVDSANKFIHHHFEQVSSTEDFRKLGLNEVTEVLNSDELRVCSEESVYNAAIQWVYEDRTQRQTQLADVLRCVRLPLLSPQFLADSVQTEECVRGCHRCRDLLDEAKDYHLLPDRRAKLLTFRTRPRCCSDVPGIVYAVGGLTSNGDSISTVECFDPIVGRWHVAENMTTHRSRVGVAVLKGRLYAIGGFDGRDRLNTVEVFDPKANKWKRVAPMNCRRSALGAAALDGKLYVCGGYDGVSSLRSCEVYFPETDEWHMICNMNDCRSAGGVVSLDEHLYALGGHNGLAIYETVERYNIHSGKWTQMAPMQSRRCRHGVAVLNSLVYAAGGYNGINFLRTVECYDPRTNQWTAVASLSTPRSRVALTATCAKLYAIGGYDGVVNLSSVERYDDEKNQWTYVAPLTAHEGGVGVGVLPILPPDCSPAPSRETNSPAAGPSSSPAASSVMIVSNRELQH